MNARVEKQLKKEEKIEKKINDLIINFECMTDDDQLEAICNIFYDCDPIMARVRGLYVALKGFDYSPKKMIGFYILQFNKAFNDIYLSYRILYQLQNLVKLFNE